MCAYPVHSRSLVLPQVFLPQNFSDVLHKYISALLDILDSVILVNIRTYMSIVETVLCFFCNYLFVCLYAHLPTCSYEMIMLRCWWTDPDERPTFSDLESDLNNFLTSVAGYLDFNEFALDVCPDPDPVPPSHQEANGLPVIGGGRDCAELAEQRVTSEEFLNTKFWFTFFAMEFKEQNIMYFKTFLCHWSWGMLSSRSKIIMCF